MRQKESHLSDLELLTALDGELSERDAAHAESHLTACWSCRARRQEIEASISDFVRLHHREMAQRLPQAAGSRALLKATLAVLTSTSGEPASAWFGKWLPARQHVAAGLIAGSLCLALGVLMVVKERSGKPAPAVFVPDSRLTPGATVIANVRDVCASATPKNRMVPVSLQKQVFAEYGVRNAEPHAYEVDYLITPALGGADDIHNLWPQSYSATVWNARVKDDLEDRMHELVCEGALDLPTAQHEISSDWIAAYKKYFHTERPLETAQP